MLWSCLHFPDFHLQLLLRAGESARALAVTSPTRPPRILSCNHGALDQGVRPGMTLSAALALEPALVERPRNESTEAAALQGLAAWAGQFTPTISLAPPDGLLLELAGSLRLFGGLAPLLRKIEINLRELGYHTRIATAPIASAALLLARAGAGSKLTNLRDLPSALAPLPLRLLDLPEITLRCLAELGASTLGQCLRLPRQGLAARFGPGLLAPLDRALGLLPDPRPLFQTPEHYHNRILLPAPVGDVEPLLFVAKRLLLELAGFLSARRSGLARLDLELHQEDGAILPVLLELSAPSRDATHLLTLLRERLSSVTLKQRVEAVVLRCEHLRPVPPGQLTLFPEDPRSGPQRWMIIDELRARLGREAVHGLAVHTDHRPELAWRACEPGTNSSPSPYPRPLWLLRQPLPLKSEGGTPRFRGPLQLLAGPECIESGWWDGQDIRRDYFLARDAREELLWVFRERAAPHGWYLHGVFA